MKNLLKTHNDAGQSDTVVKNTHKHDTNLQKNSTTYFQVGLIICLLATYGLLELNFESKVIQPDDYVEVIDDSFEPHPKEFEIYEEPVKEVKPVEKKQEDPKVLTNEFKEVDNNHDINEVTKNIITEAQTTDSPTANIDDINVIKEDEEIEFFSMIGVEKVPVYPGCESKKTNKQRKKCMSDKLGKLIQRKFNTGLAEDLDLNGRQRINVEFKIDKNGDITDVKARAPHKQLEKEALRLTTKIPKMTPGKQRGKPVTVLYNLPITFDVQN